MTTIGRIAASILLIALSARISTAIPGTTVPQSAQTLAVLLVGGFLGARLGSLALLGYLAFGALGAPVFADGASGWTHLFGPTSGYLLGFVLAAALVGWSADRGKLYRIGSTLVVMLAGHAVILGAGWLGLVRSLGPTAAFAAGVAPFLVGGLVKSVLAAGIIGLERLRSERFSAPPSA